MATELSLAYYLSIASKEKRWIHPFAKGISMKWSAKNFV